MWSIRDPQTESAATRLARRKAWHQWHAKNGYTTDRWFVIAHHLGQLMQLDPKSYRLPMERAWAFASMQEWSKAAADLELAMEKPECDADAFAQRAELFLYKRDLDSFRKACENMRDRFGSRNDLNIVNSLLWTSVLHPSVATLARELVSKAEAALANASPKDRRELLNTVGAVMYRAGRLDDAIKLFNESVSEQRRGGLIEDWVFLAMAHHKKGNKDKAKEYLDRVTEELKKLRAGIRPSDGRGLDWRLLIELESLYAEAYVICK